MTESKDFRYLIDNTESIEGLKALYNLASTEQDKKEERYNEVEKQIEALEKEKKELERYGWYIPIPSIIKNKIGDLVVGETECSE